MLFVLWDFSGESRVKIGKSIGTAMPVLRLIFLIS